MKPFFSISRYRTYLVFLIAGLSVTIAAYSSVNLFSLSMANLHFLRQYGWRAVTEGGLVQLAEIGLTGAGALAFFILYKICESELVIRYRRWQDH